VILVLENGPFRFKLKGHADKLTQLHSNYAVL